MASYRIHRGPPLSAEIRRIATDQLDRGLAELDGDDVHDGVHQVRKRCKKLRALLRLIHAAAPDVADKESEAFRDTSRRISELRDHAALLEALDHLVTHTTVPDATVDAVTAGLLARREVSTATIDAQVAAVRQDLKQARTRVAVWPLPDGGFDLLADGLQRTYRLGRRRFDDAAADASTHTFHEWRKRVKDHRYQVRLLQDSWPRVLRAHRRELHTLGELLGDDHDLAVLRGVLAADPATFGGPQHTAVIRTALDRHRGQLQAAALDLGARCYAEPPRRFTGRLVIYIDAWQSSPGDT